MGRSIDRRSFQFHGMELYELMSQQASCLRAVQRARRRLIAFWMANRLALVLAAGAGAGVAWKLVVRANRAGGVGFGSGAALVAILVAILIARWLPTSPIVAFGQRREQVARAKYDARQAALTRVNELLRARAPKAAESIESTE